MATFISTTLLLIFCRQFSERESGKIEVVYTVLVQDRERERERRERERRERERRERG